MVKTLVLLVFLAALGGCANYESGGFEGLADVGSAAARAASGEDVDWAAERYKREMRALKLEQERLKLERARNRQAQNQKAPPSPSLEERFYQVAFYDEDNLRVWPLYRFEGLFSVRVINETPEDRRSVGLVVQQVLFATGLSGGLVESGDAAVSVQFVSDSSWATYLASERERRARMGLDSEGYEPLCSADQFSLSGNTRVIVVRIPKSHSSNLRAKCIAQEISHATGLYFDTDGRSDTVFGDYAGATQLSPIDVLLLQILYDRRLQTGMTWTEARPIVRQIISELQS